MEKVTDHIIREYANVLKFDGKFSRNSNKNVDISSFTKDELIQFMDIEHVNDIKFYRYNFATTFIKKDISEVKREISVNGNIVSLRFPNIPVFVFGYNMSLFHLETDGFELEKGRMFNNNDEVVIDKNRLRLSADRLYFESGKWIESDGWNDLDLDDKIILRNDDGIYKEFTIVGIKKQNPNDDINTHRWMIYTTFESAEYFNYIVDKNATGYAINSPNITNNHNFDQIEVIYPGYEVLIYLDYPDNYWEVKNKMLDMGVLVEPLFSNFNILINLIRNMQSWSVIFMILTILIIIFVTIVSTLILFNTRKYEIAVLRSLGMKKSRLILNYLIENLTFIWGITIISLIVVSFIASIFTDSVFAGMKDLMSVEIFENLIKNTNFKFLLQNMAIVFCGTSVVVMLSLIIACINIIRFEPLKIFNKQY